MNAQALLRRATGLNLSKSVVERALRERALRLDFRDPGDYLRALTPDELSQLIELVIVPESWLFRDPQTFNAAADFILARLARPGAARPGAARPIHILSLPCASGEEPYSIAMALRDAGVPNDAFAIDAFDLSEACIARAKRGVYGRNAFRTPDLGFRQRYFTHVGADQYRIVDSLREQVTFRQGNLLQFDTVRYANYYDLVFCRNLLIYFDQATTKAAIASLAAILRDDGMLLAGYAEVPSFCLHGFASLPYRQAFALRKAAHALAPTHPNSAMRSRAPQPGPVPPAPARRPAYRDLTPSRPAHPGQAQPDLDSTLPQPAGPAPDPLAQARRLADLGHFEEATRQCRAHLAVAPDAAEAHFILGMLNEQAGQAATARECWRRCIYLQPDHYDALCHLALLAEADGDMAGARALQARAGRIFLRRRAASERLA